MQHRHAPPGIGAVLLLLVLCMSWGFVQVAIKVALHDVAPIAQSAIRSIGAAMLVFSYARLRGIDLRVNDGTLWPGVLAGLLFAGEFCAVYMALRSTGASRVSIYLYTAPLWVALGSALFIAHDRATVRQLAGFALAFAGVALSLSGEASVYRGNLLGDALALLSGAMWGGATIVIKATRLANADFTKVLLYQLVVSAPVLAIASWIAREPAPVFTPIALASLAYQTVWIAGVTYLAWFWLIERYSAARLSSFTFITPVLGVACGAMFLGEPITGVFGWAVLLVLAGLVLVNWPSRLTAVSP